MAFTPWVALPGEKTADVHRPFHPGPQPHHDEDMGIPVIKAGFSVDCAKSGGRRIAVPLMYLYATIVRPDPVRTLSHPTCVLLIDLLK
ncbi:hypothetical protein AVEN_193930-1 [Araneus ventricosus]|uniref:Uncharacterized protein n=1 Tax=Araneus ventricosus TaxID=182803 RepID=A0A4Y2JVN2_ARAVE|nr:hypothetical protein AVEN_193930-1 [Araneus ventricosus]